MTDPAEREHLQADILLSYQFVTRFPTKRGNLRLTISNSGEVRVQRNETEPPPGEQWTAPLPDEPTAKLRRSEARLTSLLEDNGFFEMAEHQVNEAATEGTIRTLRWNGRGGPRTVVVDRARSESFDRIVAELSRLLSLPGL